MINEEFAKFDKRPFLKKIDQTNVSNFAVCILNLYDSGNLIKLV